MTDLAASRRAVTRALFTLPILVLPATVEGMASPTVRTRSVGMTAAINAYRAAEEANGRHYTQAYKPAWDAWRTEVAAIPHFTTKTCMRGWAGFHYLSTSERGMVNMARVIIKDAKPGSYRDYEVAAAELLEAEQQREAESDRLADQYNVGALSDEHDRLGEIRDNSLSAVEAFPACSLADLIAKVEIIQETEGQIALDDLLADLCRIAGRA